MFRFAATTLRRHQRAQLLATAEAATPSKETRKAWADAIRGRVANHSKAWACITSPHKRKALTGSRRSAKSTSIGHATAGNLVEFDNHICWVFVDKLADFSRNWLARGWSEDDQTDPADALQTGLLQQLALHRIPYTRTRNDANRYTGVKFPWGSQLIVFPAESANQVASARGGAFHDLWLDEAQKMPQILAILDDIGDAAAKDFGGSFWMTGTPGEEVGSFFHRVSVGDNPDWQVHDITSADNPHFGSTWRQRYERSVLRPLEASRHTHNLSDQQIDRLSELTEDTFTIGYLSSQSWVELLPAAIRREALRLWVAPGTEMIFPQDHIAPADRYWADWAPAITPAALGLGVTVADVIGQALKWPERFKQLPRDVRHGREYAKHFHAAIGQDLTGMGRDPMGLTLHVWDDVCLYEFDSAKASGLRGDEQLALLAEWVKAAKLLPNVTLWGVVIDDDGGATPSMVEDWRHKLVPHLPMTGIMDAYKPKRGWQVTLLNAERVAGQVKILRNGPLDIEEQHLRREPWDPERPGKKRDQDKHRRVHLRLTDPTGRDYTAECTPGNDVSDARRYLWWRATKLTGTMSERGKKPPRMSEGEWLELRIQERTGIR